MKKIFLMACAVLLHFFITYAQYSVSGKITDSDNLPLEGAIVYLPEMNKGTVSDHDGRYELSGLPSGKLKIQFSFVGYTNRIETILLEEPAYKLDIILETSVIRTEEIVISGGYSSTQHENAVKIEVLGLKSDETRPTPNVAEILTRIPGVSMISKGSGVSKPVIRGLSMNDILVLNNGVRLENYQYSDHHPLGMNESGIGDIEVIKGPSSLLYGSDAIGGVINFIPEKPAPVGQLEGDYNLRLFSNTLGMNNDFGIKFSSQHFFGGFRAGHSTHADFLQGGGTFVPNTRFYSYSVKLNTGYTGKPGTFKLFYDFNRQNLGLAEEEAVESVMERGRNVSVYYQQFNSHLLSSQNKLYLGNMKLDVHTAFQQTGLSHFGGSGEYEIQMRLNTLTWDAKLYLPSDRYSEYIVGYQGMYQNNLNLNNREVILLPDASIGNNSLYFLIQRTFFSKIRLQTGLRYDNRSLKTIALGLPAQPDYRPSISKNYNSLSGSLGATYQATDKLFFRSNLAAAYRTPNLAELTSKGQHESRYEIGNPDLAPEKSFEADASLHYHADNLTIDAAGFYNTIQDYIFISSTTDTTEDGLPVYLYGQNHAGLFGFEAGIHVHPAHLKWLHLLTTFSAVNGRQKDGEYLPFIPAHKIFLEIRVEKEQLAFLHHIYLTLSTTMVLDQKRVASEETPTNGYALFDLLLGGRIPVKEQMLTLGFGITNLFDATYRDHMSTLRDVGYCDPGRNFTVMLKVPFTVRKP